MFLRFLSVGLVLALVVGVQAQENDAGEGDYYKCKVGDKFEVQKPFMVISSAHLATSEYKKTLIAEDKEGLQKMIDDGDVCVLQKGDMLRVLDLIKKTPISETSVEFRLIRNGRAIDKVWTPIIDAGKALGINQDNVKQIDASAKAALSDEKMEQEIKDRKSEIAKAGVKRRDNVGVRKTPKDPLHLAELVADVQPLNIGGVTAGPMTLGKEWIPIAFGEKRTSADGKSVTDIAVAVRTFGNGRILAAGHSFLTVPNAKPQLGFNAIRWLDTQKTKTICVRQTRWSGATEGTLVDKCVKLGGYRKRTVPQGKPLLPGNLAGCGVLVYELQWDKVPAAEYELIEKYVQNGGGLIMVGLAWSWASYVDKNIENYPMNQLGTHFGVHFDDGYSPDHIIRRFYPETP